MKTKLFKKIVSVICSAALMLTAASTMMFTSVSATITDDTYDNFFWSYAKNMIGDTRQQWDDSDSAGKYLSINSPHGVVFPGATALKLNVRWNLTYDESSSVLKFSSNYSSYLSSGKYKLVVFEYTDYKGVVSAGKYKFSAYEMSQSATSLSGTATELKTVDFTNDTEYASYCGGKVKAFDVGEFELKDGANNAIYLAPEQLEGNTLYCCGVAAIPVTDSETLTTDIISTQPGASIRLKDDGTNGIRFYSTFDETKAEEKGVTATGTLIAPKDLVDENGGELTKDIGEANYLDVKYDLTKGLYTYNNETKYVVGSIVGIKPTNTAREFVARGYVVIDGVTYYSETTSLDEENKGRSIKYIANAFRDDYTNNKLSGEDKAKYEANKTLINGWADYTAE